MIDLSPKGIDRLREATERTIRLVHQRGSTPQTVTQHPQAVIDDCKIVLAALDLIEQQRREIDRQQSRIQELMGLISHDVEKAEELERLRTELAATRDRYIHAVRERDEAVNTD